MTARPLILSALSAASLLALGLAGTATPARAQLGGGVPNPSPFVVPSLEFQGTDVRQALRELFKLGRASYTISPNVQGTVTLSVKNVPLETVLQNLTGQADATYRVEGGVYHIVRRDEPNDTIIESPFPQAPPPALPGDPPALAVDGNSVFVLRHGVLTKVDKKTMKIVGQVRIGEPVPTRVPGSMGGGFGR